MTARVPVWLDVDPGHDDAFAILFAAYHPSLDLLGVSTTFGNASLTKTTNNALAVLQAIGKDQIPVFAGASRPFCRTHQAATDIHGESGLDGTDLLPMPRRRPLTHCNAIKEMRDALMACAPGEAALVCCGPLTNAALLFSIYPEVVSHIKCLSIMGGAVGDGFTSAKMSQKDHSRIGNTTRFAEFNIWCDPESAQSIFRNQELQSKTILITLDLTHSARAGQDVQDMLLGGAQKDKPSRMRRMFNELLLFFTHTYGHVFGLNEGPPLHDPLAVAALLMKHPDDNAKIAFDDRGSERWDVSVVLEGAELGRTKVVPSEKGVIIPRSLALDRFWIALDQCMASADRSTGGT